MNLPVTGMSPHYLRTRMGKICVAIIGETPAELVEKAEEAIRENHFLEFRLDYLAKPALALPKLKEFMSDRGGITAIATCRREVSGGKFKGSLAAEVEILTKAIACGFHLIDLELESAEAMKRAEFEKLRSLGAGLIVSHHDFSATKDLDGVLERILPFQPDFIKIVSTAKSLADNVTMMHFLEKASNQNNLVGVCMGEQGIISRVLGLRAGSAFTFAAATVGEETAPGQIAARTLIDAYRAEQIDAATRIYGVAGNPVKHSLSPIMMNTAFRRETVNAVYLPLQTSKINDLLTLGARGSAQRHERDHALQAGHSQASGQDGSPFGEGRRLQHDRSFAGRKALRI